MKDSPSYDAQLKEFNRALDTLSFRLASGDLNTPPRYTEVFLRGLELIRKVARYDLRLAKDQLRNMVESSIVLLVSSGRDTVTVRIVNETPALQVTNLARIPILD